MSNSVKIDKKRLVELERAEKKLHALENGGVDNWEWYSEAMKPYNEENEIDELVDTCLEEIEVALFTGAYEPSERGAGFACRDESREDAKNILLDFIKKLEEVKKDNK